VTAGAVAAPCKNRGRQQSADDAGEKPHAGTLLHPDQPRPDIRA
jgi:hypothetical protein